MEKVKKYGINFIIIFSIMVTSICVSKKVLSEDIFFSIANGREIGINGIDMKDHLSWHEDMYYTYSHWLFDVVVNFIYIKFNFYGIRIFTILCTFIFGFTFFKLLKKMSGCSKEIALYITILTLILGNYFFDIRPQIISYTIFIIEIYLLDKLRNNKNKWYDFIFLFILSILLANIHASFWPLLLIFFIPYFIESFTKVFDNNSKKIIFEKNSNILKFCIAFFICILAGFLTPIHMVPFTHMFKILGDGYSISSISELEILNFLDIRLIFMTALTGFAFGSVKVKTSISDIFLLLGLFLMAILATRCIAYLLFIGIIVLVKIINNQYKNIKIISIITRIFSISSLVIMCIFLYYKFNYKADYIEGSVYPVDACEYILNNLDIKNMKIFNDFVAGSYIEFRGIPAFIDARSEMYTEAYNDVYILKDYIDFISNNITIEEIVEKYGINYILIRKNIINIFEMSKKNVIYDDEYFYILKIN